MYFSIVAAQNDCNESNYQSKFEVINPDMGFQSNKWINKRNNCYQTATREKRSKQYEVDLRWNEFNFTHKTFYY